MQILSIRCGLTRNLGNYESAKLEVEAAPSDGQSSDELLTEVKGYLEKALPEGGPDNAKAPLAGGKAEKAAAAKKAKAEKAAAKKAETAKKKAVAERAQVDSSEVQLADKDAENESALTHRPAEKAEPAKPTKDGARMVFKSVTESATLEELLKRFNEFRDPGPGYRALLSKEEWAKSINAVQDCYKSLTTAESDADVMHDLVAAINGERNAAE